MATFDNCKCMLWWQISILPAVAAHHWSSLESGHQLTEANYIFNSFYIYGPDCSEFWYNLVISIHKHQMWTCWSNVTWINAWHYDTYPIHVTCATQNAQILMVSLKFTYLEILYAFGVKYSFVCAPLYSYTLI